MTAENKVTQRYSGAAAAIDSGGQSSTGAITVTGRAQDTEGITGRRFQRIHCEWAGFANLGSGRRLRITSVLQDSTASGGTFAAYKTGTTKTAAANATTATAAITDFAYRNEYHVDGSMNRYVREVVTHHIQTTTGGNTTATGSGFTMAGVLTLAEANRLPASG